MTLGKHECKIASNTDLKGALIAGLDEVFTALEESFSDLTDEQAHKFLIEGHNNIAWIVMHCLDNLDHCAVEIQTGKRITEYDFRWDLWQCKPEEHPKPGDSYPAIKEMLSMLNKIRETALPGLKQAEESALIAETMSHPQKPTKSDFYMRTICHTNTHIRQIWLLRGALGLTDDKSWPPQHWS